MVASRGLPRAVYVLQAGLVVNALGNGAANPFAALYLNRVRGIPLALAGLTGSGFGECLYDAIYAPLVADLAPEGHTGRYLATSGLTWQLSLIVAPAVGGVILGAQPLALWPIVAGVSLAAGLYALRLDARLPPALRRTPRSRTTVPA